MQQKGTKGEKEKANTVGKILLCFEGLGHSRRESSLERSECHTHRHRTEKNYYIGTLELREIKISSSSPCLARWFIPTLFIEFVLCLRYGTSKSDKGNISSGIFTLSLLVFSRTLKKPAIRNISSSIPFLWIHLSKRPKNVILRRHHCLIDWLILLQG